MTSKIGVGIVGLSVNGGWAARAHVPALAALDGYELRALAASGPESARAAGEHFGVAHGSVDDLVARDDVDLVVVTVKVPHHRELVMAALEAGKSVLSEWPLGNGLAEAEEMAAAAESRGLRGFVGLQARSAAPVRHLRDLISDGYVGEVLSTSIIASGGRWGATFEPRGEYLLDRGNGATMLTIPFGHTVDALAMVLGEFTEVSSTIATRRAEVGEEGTGRLAPMTAEDQLVVAGVLDGGAVASVHYRGGISHGTGFHWEINGTEGDLVISGENGHLQFGQVTLRGARAGDAGLAEIAVPAEYDLVPGVARTETAHAVAHAYVQIRADLESGTTTAPDFAHAVHRHRELERIRRAARS
ncbi:putative dehydrogenase [Saccharopolyspora erythraea NRRL 2338]|uniref:Oxidoreductase n=2 Tax=Saccharopolyspora erythraea TaxID=1836 RepID=A4F7L6_SACEN|nr:Gfo/Idh/MocA family oxidoreductase [Saccharopolyspora erythraea]EQD87049.1 oxidoreductase [Saccharopolyspora erythraea D]PFG93844.1 putative dehydrogenase [Saccharopolyspora erythraea NRRL 2338]QRK90670.1 Gfo/Idh/MocA family oxidoreductase [Saccharopolyspora erythraea]CAM00040.1 oxidoreductase [Saccharopolyspora erythraea NRRL 2338]